MKQIAVFTRNYHKWLEEAVEVSKQNPNATTVFRSRSRWVTALREIPAGGSLPIYMAVVGGQGIVEYVAELCDGQLDPQRGNATTEALLKRVPMGTKHEGLWEPDRRPVKTLYAIRDCREVKRRFPITRLVKISDGKPISPDYGYSYAIDHRLNLAI